MSFRNNSKQAFGLSKGTQKPNTAASATTTKDTKSAATAAPQKDPLESLLEEFNKESGSVDVLDDAFKRLFKTVEDKENRASTKKTTIANLLEQEKIADEVRTKFEKTDLPAADAKVANSFYDKLRETINSWEKKDADSKLKLDNNSIETYATCKPETLLQEKYKKLINACMLYGYKYLAKNTKTIQMPHHHQYLAIELIKVGLYYNNKDIDETVFQSFTKGLMNIQEKAKQGDLFKELNKLMQASSHLPLQIQAILHDEQLKINELLKSIYTKTGEAEESSKTGTLSEFDRFILRRQAPANYILLKSQSNIINFLLNKHFMSGFNTFNFQDFKKDFHAKLFDLKAKKVSDPWDDDSDDKEVEVFKPPIEKNAYQAELNEFGKGTVKDLFSKATTASYTVKIFDALGAVETIYQKLEKAAKANNQTLEPPAPTAAATIATKDQKTPQQGH